MHRKPLDTLRSDLAEPCDFGSDSSNTKELLVGRIAGGLYLDAHQDAAENVREQSFRAP